MRLKPAVLHGIAITRRHGGGQHDAQAALCGQQHLGVMKMNLAFLAGQQISKFHTQRSIRADGHKNAAVAFLNGGFILVARFGLGHHAAVQLFAVEQNIDTQQHSTPGHGAVVADFYIVFAGVEKALLQMHVQQISLQLSLGVHAEKMQRSAISGAGAGMFSRGMNNGHSHEYSLKFKGVNAG